MRATFNTLLIAASFAAVAASAQASPDAQPAPKAPVREQLAANSASEYGVAATFTGAQMDIGYSSSSRRIADCLASFPGYNPKTDMVWSRNAAPQRCKL